MSGYHRFLNVATVLLLFVIALAFIFMPRHNYDIIVTRLAGLNQKLTALESAVAKVNILPGEGREEKRAAIVGKIDLIAMNLLKANEDQVAFLENLATTSESVEDLKARVSRMENVKKAPVVAGSPTVDNASRDGVERAVLREDPRPLAKGLSPNQIAEMDFERFLDAATEKGLPPFPGGKFRRDQIPNDIVGRLKSLFTAFRSSVEMINEAEQLLIEELVEKATKEGNYVEEGVTAAEGSRIEASPEAGTVFVKNLEGGRRRLFYFPAAENVGLRRTEELRENALISFMALLSLIPPP